MIRMKDYLPQKAVAQDLGVSLATLWRARSSNLPDFPEPTIIRGQVFWKKSELQALEDALMQFKGRSVFERQRNHAGKVSALRKLRANAKRERRQPVGESAQQELFAVVAGPKAGAAD